MPTPSAHEPRQRFDTLFTEDKHFRGDCRLIRTAVRRGWLDDEPPAVREALIARFVRACDEREAAGDYSGKNARAFLARAYTMIEMERRNQSDVFQLEHFRLTGDTVNKGGRPRERFWHVGDYSDRIDANAIRRAVKAAGRALGTVEAITVRNDDPDEPGERVDMAVVPDRRYGWRLWLLCPVCRCRRVHLYPAPAGIRCRTCLGIGYRSRSK